MKKRAQVAIFMILGILLVVTTLIFLHFRKSTDSSKSEMIQQNLQADADTIMNYADSCLKEIAEDGIFNLIGPQGGYISMEGKYDDAGPFIPPASFQGFKVPYYSDSGSKYAVPVSESEKKLSNYIKSEFPACIMKGNFSRMGFQIVISPSPSVLSQFNENDVTVMVLNPLSVSVNGKSFFRDSLSSKLPIRVKALEEAASKLTSNALTASEYNISKDCGVYNTNGKTNVYLREIQNGYVIQLVDFSTYEKNYFKSLIFQFAISGPKIVGSCA